MFCYLRCVKDNNRKGDTPSLIIVVDNYTLDWCCLPYAEHGGHVHGTPHKSRQHFTIMLRGFYLSCMQFTQYGSTYQLEPRRRSQV